MCYLLLKMVSRCLGMLWDEGHSGTGWGIGGSVWLQAQSPFVWVTANCTALLPANAGQYATSSYKPLLFWFPCKRQYINVRTLSVHMNLSIINNFISGTKFVQHSRQWVQRD